jgi:hypothetical protein
MEKEKPRFKEKHIGKIVKPEKLYVKEQKKIKDIEIDEINKNISLHIQDNIKDHIREEESNSEEH